MNICCLLLRDVLFCDQNIAIFVSVLPLCSHYEVGLLELPAPAGNKIDVNGICGL